jgi:pyruvate/2-oxoglutarate dehydrogenase complex dihydrolipoamide acyltransferase (E2) component
MPASDGTPAQSSAVAAHRFCFHMFLQKINEFGRKARDGTLSIDEMAGGTFTIR